MGKKQKSPNTSHVRLSKKVAVSETESESSSEEKTNIPLLNIVNKIKREPESSSGCSDSESDKNRVFTQKSSKNPLNTREQANFTNAIKKEVDQTSGEDSDSSDSSSGKHIFQTNKYLISKSVDTKPVKKSVQSNHISQDSDEPSSSSEEDTLRSAFLGKVNTKSNKKSPAAKLQSKQKLSSIRQPESSSSEEGNKKVPLNTSAAQKKKVKAKDSLKLGPRSHESLPYPVENILKTKQPEKINQKKRRKSNPSILHNNENLNDMVEDSNNTVEGQLSSNSSTVAINKDSSSISCMANTNKVQVLQHIKFTPMKPKELLQDLYPDLTTVNIKDELHISDNEEVYILRIPKAVNPQELFSKEVDLILGSKVKLGSGKYEFEPTNKAPDTMLLVGNQSRVVQPKNTYFLKKYIKSPKLPDLEVIEKAMVPLPENLKPRHPLFGSNYEDKIQLSNSVELRLQKAIDDCLKEKGKKKNKKKKMSSSLVENDMNENEVIFSLLGNHTAQKSNQIEVQSDSAFDSSKSHNISAKKKKAKRKSTEVKESTMLLQVSDEVEDEVSSKNKKKNKSRKSTDLEWKVNNVERIVNHEEPFRTELSMISSLDQHSDKIHQHKEEKNNKSSVFGDRSLFESTRIEGVPNTSNKKESLINQTINKIKTELLTEYESEWDETLMTKKKKKKRKSLPEETKERIQNGIVEDIKQEIMADFQPFIPKMRKRSMSTLEDVNYSDVPHKKSKKSKKNSSFNGDRFSLESQLDNLLEKVKKDKKIHS